MGLSKLRTIYNRRFGPVKRHYLICDDGEIVISGSFFPTYAFLLYFLSLSRRVLRSIPRLIAV